MLVVFSPIFMADTKINFGYYFVALLKSDLPIKIYSSKTTQKRNILTINSGDVKYLCFHTLIYMLRNINILYCFAKLYLVPLYLPK